MAKPENENVTLVIWAVPHQGLHQDRSTLAEINRLLRGLAIWSQCYYWNSDRNGTIRIDEFAEDYAHVFAPENESELSDAAPPATPTGDIPFSRREDDDRIKLESDDDVFPSTTPAVGAFFKPTAPKHTMPGQSSAAPRQLRLESGSMRDKKEAQVGTTSGRGLTEDLKILQLQTTRVSHHYQL